MPDATRELNQQTQPYHSMMVICQNPYGMQALHCSLHRALGECTAPAKLLKDTMLKDTMLPAWSDQASPLLHKWPACM